MPTYVYQCSGCEKTFEVEQRITEDPLKDCSCGAQGSLKRLIQPIAVMFKGAGFHINDYASSKPADAPTETKTEASTETPASVPAAPACNGQPASCPACSTE
jgi:putative FmdB family regulatory protein